MTAPPPAEGEGWRPSRTAPVSGVSGVFRQRRCRRRWAPALDACLRCWRGEGEEGGGVEGGSVAVALMSLRRGGAGEGLMVRGGQGQVRLDWCWRHGSVHNV